MLIFSHYNLNGITLKSGKMIGNVYHFSGMSCHVNSKDIQEFTK